MLLRLPRFPFWPAAAAAPTQVRPERQSAPADVPAIAPVGAAQPGCPRSRELGFDDGFSESISPGRTLAMLTQPEATLDPAALARLSELDPSGANKLLERVLQAFQTSVARLRPQLLAARGSGDHAAVRLVAHTLKSSSASIGALQLSQLCAQVEAAIRVDADAPLDTELDALDAALDSALQAIARLLEQRA